jgi:hypothetical protein
MNRWWEIEVRLDEVYRKGRREDLSISLSEKENACYRFRLTRFDLAGRGAGA